MNNRFLRINTKQILSKREIDVVIKRLGNKHLTQTESNYLSRSIRPKLREAEYASKNNLLSLLDYRRKKHERKNLLIRNKILAALSTLSKQIKAIILFGSFVQNHHTKYRDIDVLIVFKKKQWQKSIDRHNLAKQIEKDVPLTIDVQLTTITDLQKTYPYSPLLQTQLEEYEIIYGKVTLPKHKLINKPYLNQQLLEIEPILELSRSLDPNKIYTVLRQCIAVKQFLNKSISNKALEKTITNNIGATTVKSLKDNTATNIQRKIALTYAKALYHEVKNLLK
tara:strand:+ start:608 stop:1450 length:843 start_codon:yes stop_codon:yes gene_type:complete